MLLKSFTPKQQKLPINSTSVSNHMRIFLAALVIIIGANIGLSVIDYVSTLQDAKMQKLCKIDSSYCKE